MDFTTILGIISGMACLFAAIYWGGGARIFFNLPSLMITVGGTFAATLINFPMPDMVGVVKILKNAFTQKELNPTEMISSLVTLSDKARRQGTLSLEEDMERVDDDFLRKGLQWVIDGVELEAIEVLMRTELAFQKERHRKGQSIFTRMGYYAPAFGMVGTLIGLIQMLRTMEDPSTIGVPMATALVTTFYGALMANLIFLPIAGKLKTRSEEETLIREIIMQGVLLIQSGENPRIVAEKLKAFLSPKLREDVPKRR